MNVSEKHWFPLPGSPLGAGPANPGMCPDRESNWQTFGLQDDANPLNYPSQSWTLFLTLFLLVAL